MFLRIAVLLLSALWAVFILSGTVSAEPVVLKVMTYNIHHARNLAWRLNLAEILNLVKEQQPDILALQEVPLADLERIRAASGWAHVVQVATYNGQRSGLGIISRWPLSFKAHTLSQFNQERAFIQAEIDINGFPLAFYNMHLTRDGIDKDTPIKDFSLEMSSDSPRYKQIEQLKTLLEQDRRRFKIVAGDFNTFTNSRPYSQLRMVLEEATEGFPATPGTFRAIWFYRPKIDHIFHSANIKVRAASVIEKGPSDHYPVTAVMEIDPDCAPGRLTAEAIKKAQTILSRLGWYRGAIDGLPGPQTRKAVARYQAMTQRTVDGCLDESLIRYLLGRNESGHGFTVK